MTERTFTPGDRVRVTAPLWGQHEVGTVISDCTLGREYYRVQLDLYPTEDSWVVYRNTEIEPHWLGSTESPIMTTPRPLQIGDRVRTTIESTPVPTGYIGTITDTATTYDWVVTFDADLPDGSTDRTCLYNSSELELLEPLNMCPTEPEQTTGTVHVPNGLTFTPNDTPEPTPLVPLTRRQIALMLRLTMNETVEWLSLSSRLLDNGDMPSSHRAGMTAGEYDQICETLINSLK